MSQNIFSPLVCPSSPQLPWQFCEYGHVQQVVWQRRAIDADVSNYARRCGWRRSLSHPQRRHTGCAMQYTTMPYVSHAHAHSCSLSFSVISIIWSSTSSASCFVWCIPACVCCLNWNHVLRPMPRCGKSEKTQHIRTQCGHSKAI